MIIAKIKLDSKGRLQIPSSFLKANNIDSGTDVIIRAKYNYKNEIVVEFKK